MDDATLTVDPGAAPAIRVTQPTEPQPSETPPAPQTDAPEPPARSEAEADQAAPPVHAIVEALLFASDAPLTLARLAELVGCTQAEAREAIETLNDRYATGGMSFSIQPVARGFQMMTRPKFAPWVARLHRHRSETRLSEAALETLAIIAYKQPIIRADIESIRGVACGEVLGRLREMGLVRVVGRAEVVGRPMLYGTTKKFLQVFGLRDLKDLPRVESLKVGPVTRPRREVEPTGPPPEAEPRAASA